MVKQDVTKHILIVEDSPDLQALFSQLFETEGYVLSRAFNGLQALEMLRAMEELPSLILLDIMMPVMNGIEFCRERLKDLRLAEIPVVVMTADVNSQAQVRQFHIAEFIRKPINDVDKLFEIVERFRMA